MDYSEIKFSPEELNRYNRQIIYPDWGYEGQEKVKQANVFIAGAGGLGWYGFDLLGRCGGGEALGFVIMTRFSFPISAAKFFIPTKTFTS